ncbi:SDR1, partial [Symbiodinium sp. KB8]
MSLAPHRRILVTGANKGIGLAIVRKLLTDASDTFVYLGSRDRARGEDAVRSLIGSHPEWRERVELLLIDPTSEPSVAAARHRLEAGRIELYGIVNNAGCFMSFSEMLKLHLYGTKRVNDALVPLLTPIGGRIVNISSGGAPTCVAKCRDDRKALLSSSQLLWEQIDELAQEVEATLRSLPADADDTAVARATGISWGLDGYGFSKALLNSYTSWLQQHHPSLIVSCCNPGFIETDLSRSHAEQMGKTPAELGMLAVEQGAVVPCKLVLEDLGERGLYYGSDGKACGLAEVANAVAHKQAAYDMELAKHATHAALEMENTRRLVERYILGTDVLTISDVEPTAGQVEGGGPPNYSAYAYPLDSATWPTNYPVPEPATLDKEYLLPEKVKLDWAPALC